MSRPLRAPFPSSPWREALRLGAALVLALLLWLVGAIAANAPARAEIRTLQEAPGQMLYQTRQTLQDRDGRGWNAIAFKRVKPDGSQVENLRLSGFPGSTCIDRDRPLAVETMLGQQLSAPDTSAKIFEGAPEPHIGQYDLSVLLAALDSPVPLTLNIPVCADSGQSAEPVVLRVPSFWVQEWRELDARS